MSEVKTNIISDGVEHGLKKTKMSVWTIAFMMFCLVSGGAYGVEEMIPKSGPGVTMVMLIVLPFIWGMPLGLVCSELGVLRPQEGGYYKWVQEALGEFWGFQAGWWRTVSIYIDNTLYVVLAGAYIGTALNLSWGTEMAVKFVIIIIFTLINLKGVKEVGIISSILAILTLVAFGVVSICGFMNWNQNPIMPFTADGQIMGLSGIAFGDWVYYIGMGIAMGMWMYSGYESVSTFAGELEKPDVIPKGIMMAIPLIICVYLFPTLGGLAAMSDVQVAGLLGDYYTEGDPSWTYWGTEVGTVGYAGVVSAYWGPAFGIIFAVIAMLAQCSSYNAYIISGSRGFFALANDHLCPPIFVKCDKKNGVPYVSVLSVAIVNVILCQFAFEAVVVVDVLLLVASYIMIYISALILRKRIPAKEYKFRIPGGYGVLLLLCLVPTVLGFVSFYISGTDYFIGGVFGLISGPILYYIWKKRYGGLAKVDSERFPINPKTKLSVGDTKRISVMALIVGVMCVIAWPFLMWFEGDWYGKWGPEYYIEAYGQDFFLLSDFYMMLDTIKWAAIVSLSLALIFYIISKKVEPRTVQPLK